jgi:ubiquinone/menaquinone biosynthesis C-methylase UbiE
MTHATTPPNHHAHHPGFAGPAGLLAAVKMATKRGAVAELVCDLAEVGPGDRVLDIGAGPGRAVRAAARRGATAVGIDPATVMLRVARLLTRPGREIAWKVGVAESLPVEDGWATVAWSVACVHHWHDVTKGLAEVRRVLAPGGRFLGVERKTVADATGLASHGWTREQADALGEACAAAGLADVDVSEHRPGEETVLVVSARLP